MNTSEKLRRRDKQGAFTLVELMVSTALIALLMSLLLGTVDQTQNVWKRTTAKVAQFQASRAAFEAMNRRLSQATLNTYWRAHDGTSTNAAANFLFRRHSELQFLSGHLSEATTTSGKIPGILTSNPSIVGLTNPVGFAYPTHGVFFFAPIGVTEEPGLKDKSVRRFRGLDSVLTACGYFIEYGDDPYRPKILPLPTVDNPGVPPRIRFRLVELSVPAEKLTVFKREDKPVGSANDAFDIPWQYSLAPQILDLNKGHYVGRIDDPSTGGTALIPNKTWVRPFWMVEALRRTTLNAATSASHFAYGRVMAENVIALVILPKVAEKDRGTGTGNDAKKVGSLAPNYQYDSWRIIKRDRDAIGVLKVANSARDNLLPPIVQVVMVAIDETSALRQPSGQVPDWTVAGRQLFTKVDEEADLVADLDELETRLQAARVNYRVFSTDVVIRASKWSKDPE